MTRTFLLICLWIPFSMLKNNYHKYILFFSNSTIWASTLKETFFLKLSPEEDTNIWQGNWKTSSSWRFFYFELLLTLKMYTSFASKRNLALYFIAHFRAQSLTKRNEEKLFLRRYFIWWKVFFFVRFWRVEVEVNASFMEFFLTVAYALSSKEFLTVASTFSWL